MAAELKERYKIESGKLRHRAVIQYYNLVDDGAGGSQSVPTTFQEVSVSLRPLTGYETEYAKQQQMTVSHMMGMRYFPGLRSDMWITIEGTDYAIRVITDVDLRHRMYQVWVEQRPHLR